MSLSRRTFLQTAAAGAAADAPHTAPNILFLMADQFRSDCLGANGNRLIKTPNLDRLAAGAANFSNAFVQAPVCVPTRVSYVTGRYPHSHKNRVNYTPCDASEVFLQRMLKDAGYQTGCVGKLHFYPPTPEHARSTGFDKVLLHDGVGSTDPHSDYVKWRRANDPKAAVPYTSLARDTMFDAVYIPLPRRTTLEEIQKLPLPLQKLILRGRQPEYAIPRERLEWMYCSYYAAVAMVAYKMGRILDELERSQRAKDTIVIFATDHGAQLLEHGLMDKNVFFESSVDVPFS